MLVVEEVIVATHRKYELELRHVAALHGLGCELVNAMLPFANERYNGFLVVQLARATTALGACQHLFSVGYDNDAASSMRTIVEIVIDVEWILHRDTSERLQRFVEGGRFAMDRDHVAVRKLTDPTATVNAPKSVADKYGFGWAGVSLNKRAKETGLTSTYEIHYAAGCRAVHSGLATLDGHLTVRDHTVTVHVGPRVPEGSYVLAHAGIVFQAFSEGLANSLKLQALADRFAQWRVEMKAAFGIPPVLSTAG
jgi:hypothetical protein